METLKKYGVTEEEFLATPLTELSSRLNRHKSTISRVKSLLLLKRDPGAYQIYRERENIRMKGWQEQNPEKWKARTVKYRRKRRPKPESYRAKVWLDSFLQNEISECISFYNDDCI